MTEASSFPRVLLIVYLALSALCGIAPYDRAVWWVENLPLWMITATLVIMHQKGARLSNLGYALCSVLLFLHTVGGHYTFERVPFDWFTQAFGFERNHYDRIAHFTVGFYAFGIAELLIGKQRVTRNWVAYLFGIFAIGTVAALYEIIEWIYADLEGGSAGAAFLGSQGDIWDAQKDMLADTLGAVFAIGLLMVRERVSPRLSVLSIALCCLTLSACFDSGGSSPDAGASRDAGARSDGGSPATCELPIDPGSCQALFERWAWRQDLAACQRFNYGGCDGNANNFETPEACLAACSSRLDGGLPGAACMVGDLVFPSGTDGIIDPLGCNSCTCDNGTLSCTEEGCSEQCPPGQKLSSQCAACDPDLGCTIVDFRCLPLCNTNADCADTGFAQCFGDTCANPC